MKLKTELAIKAAIEAQAPAAWSRKNFEALLKQHREAWGAPQSLTTSGLIEFLIDNEIVRPVEIWSKAYDRKMRYVLGRPSPLQFALSFFKDSYLSHASALEVHGLGSSEMTYVNREQSPKKTTSRLSQGRIDMAFENQPRRSAFEFVSGSFRVLAAENRAWRGMFQAVMYPGLLFFAGVLALSETPRWLLRQGRGGRGMESAASVFVRTGSRDGTARNAGSGEREQWKRKFT
jgi:hypothetical protein